MSRRKLATHNIDELDSLSAGAAGDLVLVGDVSGNYEPKGLPLSAILTGINPQAAPTADGTSLSYTTTGTLSGAIATMTASSPVGFASVGQAEAFVDEVVKLQDRVGEAISALQANNLMNS